MWRMDESTPNPGMPNPTPSDSTPGTPNPNDVPNTQPAARPKLRSFENLDEDVELTEESLQAELAKYHEAFRQEFETKLADTATPQDQVAATKEFFKKCLPNAAAQIAWLSNNAFAESVKFNASKYIVEQALSEAAAAGDPIVEILNSLRKNDKNKQPANRED